MDYNIKFSYKQMGQKSAGIRQRVLKSQKSASSQAQMASASGRQTLTSLKTLNSSILKLIASNKDLAAAIKRSSGGGFGGGGRSGGGGLGLGSAGMGRIGGSIPIIGAGIAAAGFLVQKINQIGKAYIAKTQEQIGTVGQAGFRFGRGVYNATQMGAGMSEYAKATGQFGTETYNYWSKKKEWRDVPKNVPAWKKYRGRMVYNDDKGKFFYESRLLSGQRNISTPDKTAMQLGAIYGMSSQQSLGMAGQFKRGGANLTMAAQTAAGMGIQTELPMLLQGMASILSDAVREGIDTSAMSDDMAKNLAEITMRTPGKSVEAALSMVRSSAQVQKEVSKGKVGSFEGLMTAQATQRSLMERLTGKGGAKYIDRLVRSGEITTKEADKLLDLKKGSKFEDLGKTLGGKGAYYLLRKQAAEADKSDILRKKFDIFREKFGTGVGGLREAAGLASTLGYSLSQDQISQLWYKPNMSKEGFQEILSKGKQKLGTRERGVMTSAPATGVYQSRQLENLLLKYGGQFAQATVTMQNSLINLATVGIGPAQKGLSMLYKSMTKLSSLIDKTSKAVAASSWFGGAETDSK